MEHNELIQRLAELIPELNAQGYEVTIRESPSRLKSNILKSAASECGLENVYFNQDISKSIFKIADYLTGNYTRVGHGIGQSRTDMRVKPDRTSEYKAICKGLVAALLPYYSDDGACGGKGHFVPLFEEEDLRTK